MKRWPSRIRFPNAPLRTVRNNLNAGSCDCCGGTANWRSVYNRCWRCERDYVRSRVPIHLDKDVINWLSTTSE